MVNRKFFCYEMNDESEWIVCYRVAVEHHFNCTCSSWFISEACYAGRFGIAAYPCLNNEDWVISWTFKGTLTVTKMDPGEHANILSVSWKLNTGPNQVAGRHRSRWFSAVYPRCEPWCWYMFLHDWINFWGKCRYIFQHHGSHLGIVCISSRKIFWIWTPWLRQMAPGYEVTTLGSPHSYWQTAECVMATLLRMSYSRHIVATLQQTKIFHRLQA
jgi:hypothetical protein